MRDLPFADTNLDSPLHAWKESLIGAKQTASERLLTTLARRSFLTLWSYPNVYTDEGRKHGKGQGKELCDLLVVFGNDLLIFSDKHCEYIEHSDPKVAWYRWYRRAVEKSAKQLLGAKHWIEQHPQRLYLDKHCEHPLPLTLPSTSDQRIHLISVSRGASKAARSHWDAIGPGSSGSLVLNSQLIGEAHRDHPFEIGWPLGHNVFFHVFDEESVAILFQELDTLPDFIRYLYDKESSLGPKQPYFVTGEEDLLGVYLWPKRGCLQPSFPPVVEDTTIVVPEGVWVNFVKSEAYKGLRREKEISYLWDDIIEFQTSHVLEGSAFNLEGEQDFNHIELVLRKMAEEPREHRCLLGAVLHRARSRKLHQQRFTIVAKGHCPSRMYVIMALPFDGSYSYEEHLNWRRHQLCTYCEGVASKHPGSNEIIGIVLEPYGTAIISVDYMLLTFDHAVLDADAAYQVDLAERLKGIGARNY